MNPNPLDHLGLVRKHAKQMQASIAFKETYDDLFQVGCLGLIEACKRYQESGTAFSSYAVPWIRGEILHYLRRQSGNGGRKPLHKARDLAECEKNLIDWRGFWQQQDRISHEAMQTVWNSQWEERPVERQVLELCVLQGLKKYEAAKKLNVSDMTITRHTRDAIARLRWAYLFAVGEKLENHSRLVHSQSKVDRQVFQQLTQQQEAV